MEQKTFSSQATKVSVISIFANLILSAIKFIVGMLAHSSALVADSIHSASDVLSSIIVIVGVRMASKKSDKEHPYGHERMECVSSIVLSTLLAVTGVEIGYFAVKAIITGSYETATTPGLIALYVAAFSIVVKEAMFWYTRYYARKLDSSALMADAWHHRSDALSSIGSLVGVAGALLGFPIMDSIASLVICFFICKAALDIFKDAIDKMVDKSCDEKLEQEFYNLVLQQENILSVDLLHTRMFGNKIYVDLEISVDGNMCLKDSHAIAENIHSTLEAKYPKVKHIMVHVNPG